tara:strand:- start:6803 stop:8443 length:1641 start_codon:yes stop_codon:yes gene_type:complete
LRLGLYFHTLRYLRFRQIFFQVLRRVYRSKPQKINFIPKLRTAKFFFITPCLKRKSLDGPKTFNFFNELGNLDNIRWDGREKEKLWRYNQNYFDDLNAENAKERLNWHKNLLENWVLENSLGNTVGWDPYPLSLRAINWIKWDLREKELTDNCKKSLFMQGLFLEKNLEYHILGNHLFSNAKALIFLGCYFDNPEADRWLNLGIEIISTEINEQVLGDGGNYELSPMYHNIFLEDILDLINILKAFEFNSQHIQLMGVIDFKVIKMIEWMSKMMFIDGTISSFNDSANNVAITPLKIIDYSHRLGFQLSEEEHPKNIICNHLKDSGYVAIQKDKLKMIIDVGKLGPDYLLAHSHADTLSFELAMANERIFVNSGTSCYGINERRLFERSTKAHNTVEVDNSSSSEVWSSFRVAKRAYPKNLVLKVNTEEVFIKCSHDGYQKILKGKINHSRSWKVSNKKITIKDKVDGRYKSATARFILHNKIKINQISENSLILITNGGKSLKFDIKNGKIKIIKWMHSTEFGVLKSTKCIEVSLIEGISLVELS